jgi:hypothetical protein
LVELALRYSNQHLHERLISVAESVARRAEAKFCPSAQTPVPRRWSLMDRLGAQTIQALLADCGSGSTKPALALKYDISLSSVKRIIKSANING